MYVYILQVVANGKVEAAGETVEGDQVTITCDTGYEPLFSTATCIDGGGNVGGNNSVKSSLWKVCIRNILGH
jgi:hypothetical protein